MRYFFTSDNHFGHANIIKHCERPFKDVNEMNEVMIKNWNETVNPEDTVFHLGDFSMKNDHKKYFKRLNGQIIWVKGNHDKKTIIQDLIINHGGHYWHLAHNPEDCDGEYNLCGHIHKKWRVKKISGKIIVNVGVDVWGFKPISISQIKTCMEV